MKLSQNFFYTLREDVKNEDCKSSNLLVKSGMIKRVSSGIYMYMPLGLKAIRNIEKIVRDEMNKQGALELLMPSLLPSEAYEKSGRKENFGKSMFNLKDRNNRDYVLGPTHEELFVNAASSMIKSYKDMPFTIYQMATKYRDEARPRYGLIRVREFTMKDAYSFDHTYEGLDKSYKTMFKAYKNIFDKIGLDYKIVRADTGLMGGLLSEEFQAITDIGEDTIVICEDCGFRSNIEICKCVIEYDDIPLSDKEKELIHTPNIKTINDLVENGFDINDLTKTLIYKTDTELVACLIKGDRDINELKLQNLLETKTLELATEEEVEKVTNAKIGSIGPIGLKIPIIVDKEVILMQDFVVGANKTDYHYKNANVYDLDHYRVADIKNVKERDKCPGCRGKLVFKKGIEIGNTFKLGTKYSQLLDLKYLDKNNRERHPIMGSYGIGIDRVLAAVIEQNNDDKGIIFPISIAPYKVAIVLINNKDEKQKQVAEEIYNKLNEKGIDTILDDREERPGVKFNDMDLIGIPIRITVGKKVDKDKVEIKLRKEDTSKDIKLDKIEEEIQKQIRKLSRKSKKK